MHNDNTYGHTEVDLSLLYIANVLTEFFGEHVFRYGGDEFAVVSFEDAGPVAEKMALVNLRLKEKSAEYSGSAQRRMNRSFYRGVKLRKIF